jgi:cysteine-rich repeat protein
MTLIRPLFCSLLTACSTSIVDPGDTTTPTTSTDPTHVPVCGNGITEPGELCDDGNTWDGDTCSSDCMQLAPCAPEVHGPDGSIGGIGTESLSFPPVADYVAWCDLQVVLAHRESASLVLADPAELPSGLAQPLASEPGVMLLDPLRALLFVAEPASLQIERFAVPRSTAYPWGEPVVIPLPAPPIALAPGKAGRVFAVMDDAAMAPERPLAIIDGVTGVIEAVVTGKFGDLAVYDRAHDQLITGDAGTPSGALRRFAFDLAAKTLTLTQELENVGADCRDLAVSPDGARLIYLCAGGNLGTGGVVDFSTVDLSANHEAWVSGPPGPDSSDWDLWDYLQADQGDPKGVAFTPNGRGLVLSAANDLFLLNAETHHVVEIWLGGGDALERRGVRSSPHGRFMFALETGSKDQRLFGDWLPEW